VLKALHISNFEHFLINKDGHVYCNSSIRIKPLLGQKIFDKYKTYFLPKVPMPNQCFYFFDFNDTENLHTFVIIEISDLIMGYSFERTHISKEEFVNYIETIKPHLHNYLNRYKFENKQSKQVLSLVYQCSVAVSLTPDFTDKISMFLKQLQLTRYAMFRSDGKSIMLSPRQSQLMLAIVNGMSFDAIEQKFGIRKKAAELYLTNIKLKTRWQHRIQLIKAFINMNPWSITTYATYILNEQYNE
jgi:DNA-binding CsgD family transcriptional regulator